MLNDSVRLRILHGTDDEGSRAWLIEEGNRHTPENFAACPEDGSAEVVTELGSCRECRVARRDRYRRSR
jgi:hypothetical protein